MFEVFIVLYRIVSYRIVSYRIVSYRIVSYRIVSYRIASYLIGLGLSYRTVHPTLTLILNPHPKPSTLPLTPALNPDPRLGWKGRSTRKSGPHSAFLNTLSGRFRGFSGWNKSSTTWATRKMKMVSSNLSTRFTARYQHCPITIPYPYPYP